MTDNQVGVLIKKVDEITRRLDAQDEAMKPVIDAFTQAKGAILLVKVVFAILSMTGVIVGIYKFKETIK